MVSIDNLSEVLYGLFKEPVYWTNKIQDGGRPPFYKSFLAFWHNSAADRPISVKCCVGKQFFTEFLQWDR